MLRLHRLLVTQSNLILSRFRRLPYQLWKLVLPFTSYQFVTSTEAISLVKHLFQ